MINQIKSKNDKLYRFICPFNVIFRKIYKKLLYQCKNFKFDAKSL